MNISCPNSLPTTQCPGSDSPITNYTAESPDQMIFIGTAYVPTNPWSPPPITPTPDPPPPPVIPTPGIPATVYTYYDCFGVAQSVNSQAQADLETYIMNRYCNINPPASASVNPGYVPAFVNNTQIATVPCYAGQPFTYIVTDGSFAGPP